MIDQLLNTVIVIPWWKFMIIIVLLIIVMFYAVWILWVNKRQNDKIKKLEMAAKK
jgi:cytochrome bd-type quinol oxidase subunit 1